MNRRVAVTGIGVLSAVGIGKDAFWQGLRGSRSPIRRIRRFDPAPFSSQIAAEIDDFNPLEFMGAKRARRLDRFSQFCLAAAQLAVLDAGLLPERLRPERSGVYVGSALGGVAFGELEHGRFARRGLRAVSPLLALSVFGGAGAANIAIEFGLQGPCLASANGCAAGAIAIGEAARLIRDGTADVMLAGGAETPLAPLTFGAFALIHALSCANSTPEMACRPFDQRRDGFVMGEGAALFVLEEWEHAVRRGAHIYAELLGYGVTTDGYHMTAPHPTGRQVARAIQTALTEARIEPTAVDYVNAHGSSTPLNDKTEALALRLVFGDEKLRALPVSGTKPFYGHALGASGAIEVAVSLFALEQNYLPPTLNLEEPDPQCPLLHIREAGLEQQIRFVLSNSFGFGGVNTALVFGG